MRLKAASPMSNWIDFNELMGSPHLRVPVGAGPLIKARRRRAADCDQLTKARPRTAKPDCASRKKATPSQSSTRSPFRHGRGVGCALEINHGPHGEAAMSVVLNDLLLFSCLTALVTGIVISAAI